ncbi:unnamed protein product [Auanema sp. JU1783]|nr:unnamed protein product [Auanema sp. JU1783]
MAHYPNSFFNYSCLAHPYKNQMVPSRSMNSHKNLEDIKELLYLMNLKAQPSRRAGLYQLKPSKELQELLDKYDEMGFNPPITNDSVEADDYLFQGDILLNKKQAQLLARVPVTDQLEDKENKRVTRQTTTFQELWNKRKPILYDVESMSQSVSVLIRRVIAFWMKNSCVRFRETDSTASLIRFVPQSGCWSYVGHQTSWKQQEISIGENCDSFGTVSHEIAHALGFLHTQSREDRDDFVMINFLNIDPERLGNFMKDSDLWETFRLTPYDYGSVMQYDPYAFAINRRIPTVFAKDWRFQATMGQRAAPSFSDIKAMNLLYKCDEKCKKKVNCTNGGYRNPKKCKVCICPPQFKGSTCSNLNKGQLPICNSKHLKANESWTSFTGCFGSSETMTSFMDCNYLIEAEPGMRIQLKLKFLSSPYCYTSCPYQAVEVYEKNFDVAGMRLCCRVRELTFTSESELFSIRGLSRYGNVSFHVWYTQIGK